MSLKSGRPKLQEQNFFFCLEVGRGVPLKFARYANGRFLDDIVYLGLRNSEAVRASGNGNKVVFANGSVASLNF